MGSRWKRATGDFGSDRTCVLALRTIAAIAAIADDTVEFVLGDVTLSVRVMKNPSFRPFPNRIMACQRER